MYDSACALSDDVRIERLRVGGMTHRGLVCRHCDAAVGRMYISSSDPQFDWQRDVCFLDAAATSAHSVRAPPTAAASIAVKREAATETGDTLATLVGDDERLQVIFHGLQAKARATLDAVAALERHLETERMLPRSSELWTCTVAECGESFTREHRLRRHEHIVHGRPGRVTCAAMFCSLDFADVAEMEAHMVQAHGRERSSRS